MMEISSVFYGDRRTTDKNIKKKKKKEDSVRYSLCRKDAERNIICILNVNFTYFKQYESKNYKLPKML